MVRKTKKCREEGECQAEGQSGMRKGTEKSKRDESKRQNRWTHRHREAENPVGEAEH